MTRESNEIDIGYYGVRRESRGHGARRFIGYGLGVLGLAALMNVVSAQCYEFVGNRYANSWSKEMAAKLLGNSPLSSEEKRFSRVQVVASGYTLAERLEMEQKGLSVSVRNYPATVFPNGAETKIIGKVAQGTEILNVVLTDGVEPNSPVTGKWGAFDCNSVSAAVRWVEGPPKQGEMKICAIYGDYLHKSN